MRKTALQRKGQCRRCSRHEAVFPCPWWSRLQPMGHHMEQISPCSHGGAHGAAEDVAPRRLQLKELLEEQAQPSWWKQQEWNRRSGGAAACGGPLLEQCSPETWTHIKAVLEDLQPSRSPCRFRSGRMIFHRRDLMPGEEREDGGAAEAKHYGMSTAPTALLGGRRRSGGNCLWFAFSSTFTC